MNLNLEYYAIDLYLVGFYLIRKMIYVKRTSQRDMVLTKVLNQFPIFKALRLDYGGLGLIW